MARFAAHPHLPQEPRRPNPAERPLQASAPHQVWFVDLRYLVLADPRHAISPATGESRTVAWFEWDLLPTLDLDPGLVRGLAKARRHVPAA